MTHTFLPLSPNSHSCSIVIFGQMHLHWLSLYSASCPLLENVCHHAVPCHPNPLRKCPGLPGCWILSSQEKKRQASCLLVHPESSPQTPRPCNLLLGCCEPSGAGSSPFQTLLPLLPSPNLIQDPNFISSSCSKVTVTGYWGGRPPEQNNPSRSERQLPYPLQKNFTHALH